MNILVFGATGSIGNFIFNKFKAGHNVLGTTSNHANVDMNIVYVSNTDYTNLSIINKLDAVVWSQGSNFNDNIENFNYTNYNKLMDVNVSFILNTLNYLLKCDKLKNGSKLVIISSIWGDLTRDNKLSYTISKHALNGLVKSVAYDLSVKNILINNVLLGVIDNKMTRTTLSEQQIQNAHTPFNRLISLDDVYNTINFLVTANSGITGQSIKVDLGFTNIKHV
jgi:3-oxoacyl-[acyl-carrier protein] reductase